MPKLQYKNFTFEDSGDGLEQAWIVPANIASIAFQVTSGTVHRRNVTGTTAAKWTVLNNLPQGFDFRGLTGEVIYFTGTEGATMEICYVTGLMS